MRNTCFPSALILALGLFSLPSAHAQSLADEAKGFKAELPVFFKESAQLVANTQPPMDLMGMPMGGMPMGGMPPMRGMPKSGMLKDLGDLDGSMATTHKVSTELQQLKTLLNVINDGLTALSGYPPTKAKATNFQRYIFNPVRLTVTGAAKFVKDTDSELDPLRSSGSSVSLPNGANKNLFDQGGSLNNSGKEFSRRLEELGTNAPSASLPDSTQFRVFTEAKSLYSGAGKALQEVNTGYATTVNNNKGSISNIIKQLEPIGALREKIGPINRQFQPLHEALAKLDSAMNQSVGFQFDHAPSVEICWKEVPIPCLKFWEGGCSQSAPYPCPKIGVNVSISVRSVIGDPDAIEGKIKSMINPLAWEALKVIGLKKYVDQLQNAANDLTKEAFKTVLNALDFNPQLSLPNLSAIEISDRNKIVQLDKDLRSLGNKLEGPSSSFKFSPDAFLSYRTLDELREYGYKEPPRRVCLSDFARFGALGQSGQWKQSGSLELREQKHDKAIVAGDKYFGEDSRVYHQVRDQRLNGLWKFTEAPGSERLPISEKCSFVLTDDGHGRYLSGGDAPGLVYHQRWRNAPNQVWELRRVLDDDNQVMGYVLRDQRHWRCVIGGVIDSNTYNQQLSHEICMPSVRSVFKNRGNVLWNLYTSDGKLLRP